MGYNGRQNTGVPSRNLNLQSGPGTNHIEKLELTSESNGFGPLLPQGLRPAFFLCNPIKFHHGSSYSFPTLMARALQNLTTVTIRDSLITPGLNTSIATLYPCGSYINISLYVRSTFFTCWCLTPWYTESTYMPSQPSVGGAKQDRIFYFSLIL